MAKAADDTITAWEFVSEARERLAKHYGGRKTAEKLIREGLDAGTLPWDFMRLEGRDPGLRDRRFWTEYNPPPSLSNGPFFFLWAHVATINYEENSASRPDCTIRGFKVAKDYTDKLLGVTDSIDDAKLVSKVWCVAEAKRLKFAGKLDSLKNKTALAKLLADGIRKAARTDSSLRSLTMRYIRNQLKNWGLWPIDRI
jgi:hypothetical protein